MAKKIVNATDVRDFLIEWMEKSDIALPQEPKHKQLAANRIIVWMTEDGFKIVPKDSA